MGGPFMSAMLLGVAAAIAVLMVATWALSVALRNASIVDIVWGLGFVVVAWTAWSLSPGGHRADLLVAMVTLWGLRLSAYLFWRNHGAPEDFRYASMRRRAGPRFWLTSLLTVFAIQGTLMFVVSLPVPVAMQRHPGDLDALTVLGVAVWAVGLAFESVGDAQLARFKADRANAGRVMDQGLWRYTRHPNYFGDFCVWWGIFAVAARDWLGLATVVGPVTMTVLLVRVSGVALLERSLTKRREGYADYVARTSAFLPRPPRRP